MSNTLPPVTATKPERTPIGDQVTQRVDLLMKKLDAASARLDEAAERIDETWMAELDATVEAEHAKVADEIAAKVVEDLVAVPLKIDIPSYYDEPTEAELAEESERAEAAMAALSTWVPTAVELDEIQAALTEAQKSAHVITVLDSMKGLTPEPTEQELADYEATKVAEAREDIEHDDEIVFNRPEDWREVDAKVIRADTSVVGFDPTGPAKVRIGPLLPAEEVTRRLAAHRKPSPAPRKDDAQ